MNMSSQLSSAPIYYDNSQAATDSPGSTVSIPPSRFESRIPPTLPLLTCHINLAVHSRAAPSFMRTDVLPSFQLSRSHAVVPKKCSDGDRFIDDKTSYPAAPVGKRQFDSFFPTTLESH